MSTRWLQDISGKQDANWSTKCLRRQARRSGRRRSRTVSERGCHSVDIIQLNDYQYWHTPEDTVDKISAQSMKIVGDTVLASLPRIAALIETQGPRRPVSQ